MQTHTRSLSRFAGAPGIAMAFLLLSAHAGLAEDVSWTRRPGLGLDIAGNAAGALSVLGVDRVGDGGYGVFRFIGSDWTGIPGAGNRLTVAPNGDIWLLNEHHNIFRYTVATGAWQLLPGLATEIAAGGDGSVWVAGIVKVAGGYPVYRWDGSNWVQLSGGITSIAVTRDGTPWAVNNAGNIFWYNRQTSVWQGVAGQARTIHAGVSSGAVWITGVTPVAGGYPLSRWNPATSGWEPYGTFGAVDITEAAGVPWLVQSDGSIYSKQDTSTLTIVTANQVSMPLMQPASIRLVVGSNATGTQICAATDSGAANFCGTTKADYVGAYSLNLNCKDGFYDPIYGGSCWKCPADDGNGAWLRSADAVDKETACWRVPEETLSSAKKVRSPAWAWDCPSGSFWDGYSPDGIGGSCWTCPADYPRRTGNAVFSSEACASPVNETRPATLLTFNGCPTPDAKAMGLPGKRMPGKPFLDIAAGWSQGVASGGCYACPVMDEAGNFLVSTRNYSPIYDKDNNSGCRINMKWKPPVFTQPGLSGLAGVKEIIWENRLFEKDQITASLHDQAETRKLGAGTPEAKAWVASQWKSLAAAPYNSETFRVQVFALLKTALLKEPVVRTPGEKLLIASVATYIRNQNTYIARQGLGMYDSWKAYSDAYRESTAQGRSLESLFYYGTVPLDFESTLGSLVALGGTGGGLVSALVSASVFHGLVEEGGRGLFGMMGTLQMLKTATGLTIISGASLIQAAGAILTSIAVEQFVQIQTARSKLESSLAKAQQPVDLDSFFQETNGNDLLFYYWSKAMDTSDAEDPQVLSLAAQAYSSALEKGFVKPQ